MGEELRACPFCGLPPTPFSSPQGHSIGCENAVCKMRPHTLTHVHFSSALMQWNGGLRKDVNWNTRASDAELSALRDEVARLKNRLANSESNLGACDSDLRRMELERTNAVNSAVELKAKLAAAEKDAERYNECFRDGSNFVVIAIEGGAHLWLSDKNESDGAIDLAIQSRKEGVSHE